MEFYGDLSPEEKIKLDLANFHLDKIYEMFVYLGYPDWYEIKYEGRKGRRIISHLWHATDLAFEPFINDKLFDTASHTARVTLYSSAISDFFGLYKPQFQHTQETFVGAALQHDLGKFFPDVRKIAEKQEGFTREDAEKMQEHVKNSAGFAADKDIGRVIAYHHFWQKNGYAPSWCIKQLPLTPLSEILSKILAIDDFHDAAYSRVNSRNSQKRILTPDEVKELLLNEYGDMHLKYEGEEFPRTNTTGRELIHQLYDAEIFGRDRLKPYQLPFSFIWRRTPEESIVTVLEAARRYAEIDDKLEKYRSNERKINRLEGKILWEENPVLKLIKTVVYSPRIAFLKGKYPTTLD